MSGQVLALVGSLADVSMLAAGMGFGAGCNGLPMFPAPPEWWGQPRPVLSCEAATQTEANDEESSATDVEMTISEMPTTRGCIDGLREDVVTTFGPGNCGSDGQPGEPPNGVESGASEENEEADEGSVDELEDCRREQEDNEDSEDEASRYTDEVEVGGVRVGGWVSFQPGAGGKMLIDGLSGVRLPTTPVEVVARVRGWLHVRLSSGAMVYGLERDVVA